MPVDAASIEALLPQTQCTRCGYDGCRPYSEAIARGEAPINQCPPGGARTIEALATLLGREPLPLNPANGIEQPERVAFIDEARCIGCARCLPPCPVDAILGASRHMHTVLAGDCNGCELCIPACPVDCITMIARDPASPPPTPRENRERYDAHLARTAFRRDARSKLLASRKMSHAR